MARGSGEAAALTVDEGAKFVEFRSADDRGHVLRLSFERDSSGTGMDVFTVEIEGPSLACHHGVLSWNGDGLAEFLAGLVADWRGWEGTRRWDAVENGMSIEATHRQSRVELLFIVRRDFEPDAWEIRLPVLVAPGEELSNLAQATAALLASE